MKVLKSTSIRKAIIFMKIVEDGRLAVIDSETTIRFFSIDDLSVLDGFKAKIVHGRYQSSVVAFANKADYFATLTDDCKESRLYSTETKKIISKVDRHHGEASCVGIDPLSRYMFSGGEDGKTFALDTKTGKLVFTLPPHADTINDIAFSRSGGFVATASYDRKISIFSINSMSAKNKLKAHSAPVIKVRFLLKNRLLSIDKNASAIIWDIQEAKVISRLTGIHDDVTSITTSIDDKFLFIGTKLGYVLVYDLDTYEVVAAKYIKITSPITALEFVSEKNYLIIGTQDGFIMYFDIYEGEEKFNDLLKTKKFQEIKNLADTNPVLKYTKIYDLVDNLWDRTVEKAIFALQSSDHKKAEQLFSHFRDIPVKNKIIKQLYKDYEEFKRFSIFVEQGKISLAYSLANAYPSYKLSTVYKGLEKRWQNAFVEAQKLSQKPGGMDRAKDIMASYRGVVEKTPLIQDMLMKGEIYKRFLTSFGKHDFRMCSELLKQYEFLKEFPEYDRLELYADSLYIKSQELIQEGDVNIAMKKLRVLTEFTDFKELALELIKEVEFKQKFFDAIRNNNLSDAYFYLDSIDDLSNTKDGKILSKKWNDAVDMANEYALVGNVYGVKRSFEEYMQIKSKHIAIASVFSLCYISELEQALNNSDSKLRIESGIRAYLLSFGLHEHIQNFWTTFYKVHRDSKLNLELLPKGSIRMWKPSMINDSIFG